MIYDNKQRLYLDIALFLNRKNYDSKIISLSVYELVQDELLKMIRQCDNKNGSI